MVFRDAPDLNPAGAGFGGYIHKYWQDLLDLLI